MSAIDERQPELAGIMMATLAARVAPSYAPAVPGGPGTASSVQTETEKDLESFLLGLDSRLTSGLPGNTFKELKEELAHVAQVPDHYGMHRRVPYKVYGTFQQQQQHSCLLWHAPQSL